MTWLCALLNLFELPPHIPYRVMKTCPKYIRLRSALYINKSAVKTIYFDGLEMQINQIRPEQGKRTHFPRGPVLFRTIN